MILLRLLLIFLVQVATHHISKFILLGIHELCQPVSKINAQVLFIERAEHVLCFPSSIQHSIYSVLLTSQHIGHSLPENEKVDPNRGHNTDV